MQSAGSIKIGIVFVFPVRGRLSILRQAASASGSESSSRCAPLGAGEETSRAISLEFA